MFEPPSSPRSKPEHDKLAWRLTQILLLLNQGECLHPDLLAGEYGVHRRTILRDIHERFAFLPIRKERGGYALDPAYLGRLTFRDLERFAALAGLRGLFPALTTEFLREIFDHKMQEALLIHGARFENIADREGDFARIKEAIVAHHEIRFEYQKPEGRKDVQVQPYKLINHGGVWYVAAGDQGQPKAYAISRIRHLQVMDISFTPDETILEMLAKEDSIWLNRHKTEVVVKVNGVVAQYFQRQAIIPGQVIEKTLTDGGLLISGRFANPKQVFPIIQQWIPHLRIISPDSWQIEMENNLLDYLQGANTS